MGWGGAGVRPPGRGISIMLSELDFLSIGHWEKLPCLYNSMDRTSERKGLGNRSL